MASSVRGTSGVSFLLETKTLFPLFLWECGADRATTSSASGTELRVQRQFHVLLISRHLLIRDAENTARVSLWRENAFPVLVLATGHPLLSTLITVWVSGCQRGERFGLPFLRDIQECLKTLSRWGGTLPAHSGYKLGTVLSLQQCRGKSPIWRIICSKMSIVPTLRNPAISRNPSEEESQLKFGREY